MRLYTIVEESIIYRYDSDGDINGYDQYAIADMAEKIAKDGGIRIARNKDLTFVALNGENVLGAVWVGTYRDDGQDAIVYDFDIATIKGAPANVFIQLIQSVLDDFEDIKSLYNERAYIRVWVVNPRLASVLERRYGFDVESCHKGGSCHMTHY